MKKFAILIIFITSFSVALSQGGSNYSIFGIGDFNNSISANYEAIAGTSIAIPSTYAMNSQNPALLSFLGTTRLQVGYRFAQSVSENNTSSLLQNNGGINAIFASFVFDTSRKIAASIGLTPTTKVNFLVSKTFQTIIDNQTVTGYSTYQGSGGISSLYFSLSGKVIDNLHIGGTIKKNFGNIKYTNNTDYPDVYTFTNYYETEDIFDGIGYNFGLYYNYKNFSIGGFFSDLGELDVERTAFQGSDLIGDTSFSSNFTVNSAKFYGVGVSYSTGKFQIGADYKVSLMKDFNYTNSTLATFNDGNEISLGVIRYGNRNKRSPYFDQIDYKFGFAVNKMYYTVNDNPINEYKLTYGMGMPFADNGLLDLALVFAKRGSTSNGLVNEYYGKLIIDISIGEYWFIPFKREY